MIRSAVIGLAGAAAFAAYAVRGRSSAILGPSRYRGADDRRALALTFDDGPSPATNDLLSLLDRYGAKATFFQVGANVRRHPDICRQVAAAGHEIGNHTYTHPRLWLRSPRFIFEELSRAQEAITDATGYAPTLFRAPYGVRWLGLRSAQARLGLLGVMWTTIGLDWRLSGDKVAGRLRRGARNGAIFCLHDGRELRPNPDVSPAISAVRSALPELIDQGYRLVTVSELLRVQ